MFDMFTLSSLVCRNILEVLSYKILMFQCPRSPLSRTLLLSTLPTDQVLSFLELNSLIWTSLRFCRFEGALASLGWHLVLLKPIFKSLNFDLEVPKFLTWLRREYFSVNKWLQSLIIFKAKKSIVSWLQ